MKAVILLENGYEVQQLATFTEELEELSEHFLSLAVK